MSGKPLEMRLSYSVEEWEEIRSTLQMEVDAELENEDSQPDRIETLQGFVDSIELRLKMYQLGSTSLKPTELSDRPKTLTGLTLTEAINSGRKYIKHASHKWFHEVDDLPGYLKKASGKGWVASDELSEDQVRLDKEYRR